MYNQYYYNSATQAWYFWYL